MSRHKFAVGLIVAFISTAPLAVRAQDIDLSDTLYSQGVQAYFDGNSTEADAYLSRLIAIDRNDPRAYYFRALSRLREGRQNEARADMQAGADVEARMPNRFNVGKSLERVQGQARLVLEQYRMKARLNSALTPPPKPVIEPDTAVLRERRIVPLDEFSRSGQPRSYAAPEPVPPSTKSSAFPASKPLANPSAAPAAVANPFGDDAAMETAPKAAAEKTPLTPPPKAAPANAPLPPPPKSTPPSSETPADKDNPFL